MTEDEAKTKWCPFVRVTIGPDNATWQGGMLTNRSDTPADNRDVTCLGSGCMAWRRAHGLSQRTKQDHGYCGLAGPLSAAGDKVNPGQI